jgi:3-methylfumaryl-CoA hydratase
MMESVQSISSWIGREHSTRDMVRLAPILGFQATLDWPELSAPSDGIIPYLSHWLYFLPADPMNQLADDGHPRRGGFLPPVSLPRRMWAGSRIKFIRPMRIDSQVVRRSTIGDVKEKLGRTGRLVFVRIDHEISDHAGLLISESQDVVYREAHTRDSVAAVPQRAPVCSDWIREIIPSPALLFRYSALTFNSHRIHYDFPYARDAEGYAGLVVHGPLIATLLLNELVHYRQGVEVDNFEFRAIKPVISPDPFFICGSVHGTIATLFAHNSAGDLCMQASAILRGKDR